MFQIKFCWIYFTNNKKSHQDEAGSALSHRSEVSDESWNEEHQSDGEEEPARLVEEEGTDVVGDGVLGDDADLQLRSRQDKQDEILDIVRHAHQDHGHQQRQECQDLKI